MSSLSRDSLLTLGTSGVGLVFGLVSNILIARLLGPEGKGIYTLVALIPVMVYTVGNLGLGNSVTYYLARDRDHRRPVFFRALRLSFASAAVLYGLLLATLPYWRHYYSEIPVELFQLTLPLVLFLAILDIFKYGLLGAGRVGWFNLINLLGLVMGLAALAGALLWPGDRLANLVAAYVLPFPLLLLLADLILWKSGILSDSPSSSGASDRDLLTYGAKVQVVSVSQFLNCRLDQFLIPVFLGAGALGIYTIAVALSEKVWMVSAALQMALFSRTPGLEPRERSEMFAKSLRHIVLLNLVLLSGLAGAGWVLIPLLFGNSFQSAYWPMLVLLPGTFFMSIWKVAGTFFLATNRPGILSQISMLALGLNGGLNLLLIPRWGILGAAAASTVSYSATCLILIAVFHRQSGVTYRRMLVPGREDLLLYLSWLGRVKNQINGYLNPAAQTTPSSQ